MALNAYLSCAGSRIGEINGSVTQAGREDTIMVIGFDHEIRAPRPADADFESGFRHEPVVITKEIDKSTPLLHQARATREVFDRWTLDFWTPSPSGKEQNHFRIRLEGARIVAVRTEMLNNKYPENMKHKEREQIAFAYRRIHWLYVLTKKSSSDTWAS